MVIHLTAGFLPAARCLATRVRPIPGTGGDCSPPGRRPGVPVWPCTAWGLSCPGGCPPGGGLLPRLFTLTARPVQAPRGGMFSVTLSIDRDFRPGPPRVFPRHAALWCSDFPLPPRRERPSTREQGNREAVVAQEEMRPMGNRRTPARVLFLAPAFVHCRYAVPLLPLASRGRRACAVAWAG